MSYPRGNRALLYLSCGIAAPDVTTESWICSFPVRDAIEPVPKRSNIWLLAGILFGITLALRELTSAQTDRIIEGMARPEAVRRIKSYSSATGYVYQYYFYEVQKVRRGVSAGTEYVYMVSRDRNKVFPLRILVRGDAVEEWSRVAGRPLSGTEEYAAAKMRLFQAFDEVENLEASSSDLFVDQSNLDALLRTLDL